MNLAKHQKLGDIPRQPDPAGDRRSCSGREVVHIDDDETGAFRRKHLHDLRGTFATRLMTTTRLSNEDVADIMGWSVKQVAKIRKMYVSDHARTVALGKQIAHSFEADLRPSGDAR